jgi:hypothetical protein
MASPKRLRILTHSLPHFETRVLDVLTGETMRLEDKVAWDVEGKLENSVPESDSSDDESASAIHGPMNDMVPAIMPPGLDS